MTSGFLISGLLLGILGSFHCVGMCGPLALSLPVQHLQGIRRIAGIFLYNFGRVSTYAALGAILGFVGMSFTLFGWQQIFSIVLGLIMLLLFITTLLKKRIFRSLPYLEKWNAKITGMLVPLFRNKNFSALFMIGLLNGLLPCGLVYMAIAGGLASGNILFSSLFMASFGLGTLPSMLMISLAGTMIPVTFRNHARKVVPWIFALMGILLIVRGLNLNIPYLSPTLAGQQAISCH